MQVDENMQTAQQRDAVSTKKFYFRKDVFTQNGVSSGASSLSGDHSHVYSQPKEKKLRNCFSPPPLPDERLPDGKVDEEYVLLTMDEIINGKVGNLDHRCPSIDISIQDDNFPGLLSLVYAFLDTLDLGNDERKQIERYLDLVRRRSNGEVHVGDIPGFS